MGGEGHYWVEIIATGDEIMLGRIVDTNSSWMAKRIAELGARLRRITCVGDNLEEISGAVRESLARENNLLILTGGLGPSEDDLTVEGLAKALGRSVKISEEARMMLLKKCEELGLELTPRRERMARIVEGGRPLPNRIGMAPVIKVEEGATTIIALPGVPEEMKASFEDHVAPIIRAKTHKSLVARSIQLRMVWKEFFPLLDLLREHYPKAYFKPAATPPLRMDEREMEREIKMDIAVEAPSKEAGEALMEELLRELDERLRGLGGRILRATS
ncbi:MAG: competence/damage-inducible protein A [Candidatus Bathyarchaeia archaeon]